jgi:hypothetical protein
MQLLENVLYFVIWAGIIFLMMRYGWGAHIMGHGQHHGATGSDDHGSDSNMRWVPPDRAVDPVCGMTVQTAGAKSTVHDGHVADLLARPNRELRLRLVHRADLWASI